MDGQREFRNACRAALTAYPLPPRLADLLADLPVAELAFAPVPVQARRDGWTAARQAGFIQRLALYGDVPRAARGVGMSRESAWRLRRRPGSEGFAAAWDKATGWGSDRLTDLGLERALNGEVRAVHYRGRKVGEQLRFDNRLLIAVLNRLPLSEPPLPPGQSSTDALNCAIAALGPETLRLETQDILRDSA